MSANDSADGEEVRQFPLTYQMIDSGGIVPEVEDIYYEVYTTNGVIDQEMNSSSTSWLDGMIEETLFWIGYCKIFPNSSTMVHIMLIRILERMKFHRG